MFKEALFFVTTFIGVLVIIGFILPSMSAHIEGENSAWDNDCATSKYNVYSNMTTGYTWWFGKCYVNTPIYFKPTHECHGGFLGIGESCFESDNAPIDSISNTICFRLKDGSRC